MIYFTCSFPLIGLSVIAVCFREMRANQARGPRMGGQESQESLAFQEKRCFMEPTTQSATVLSTSVHQALVFSVTVPPQGLRG